MEQDQNFKEYIAFDETEFMAQSQKQGGNPSNSILGIIRARDEVHAQDTASTRFPDKIVFVRALSSSPKEHVAAAEKMGYLNTSEAHHP
jgi:hypothetical protein